MGRILITSVKVIKLKSNEMSIKYCFFFGRYYNLDFYMFIGS